MFDAIYPGTIAVSPEGDAIAVYSGEEWIVVDPYDRHTDNLAEEAIGEWIIKYSPAAVRK